MNTQSEALGVFVDRLLAEKGLEGLDTEVLDQVRKDLLSRVEDRINALILRSLPEDQMTPFSELLDSGNELDIQEFCAKHIPNLDNLIATELLTFRQTYLNG